MDSLADPLLGEHTREIAREGLGLPEDEIEALNEPGTIDDPPRDGGDPRIPFRTSRTCTRSRVP
jgi:hypothetical protein